MVFGYKSLKDTQVNGSHIIQNPTPIKSRVFGYHKTVPLKLEPNPARIYHEE
jgi:hypothetical protein